MFDRAIRAAAVVTVVVGGLVGCTGASECQRAFDDLNARRDFPLDSDYVKNTCARSDWQAELDSY